jgi:hypothetical protein
MQEAHRKMKKREGISRCQSAVFYTSYYTLNTFARQEELSIRSLRGSHFADPNIAVTHGIAMVLQSERQFFRMRL